MYNQNLTVRDYRRVKVLVTKISYDETCPTLSIMFDVQECYHRELLPSKSFPL